MAYASIQTRVEQRKKYERNLDIKRENYEFKVKMASKDISRNVNVFFMSINGKADIMKHIITEQILEKYKEHLEAEEKSQATVNKYICDLKKLMAYAGGQEITKKLMLAFKEDLRVNKNYKLSSINSFLIAANRLFDYLEWYELRVKIYRIQKEVFASADKDISKEEYKKLVRAALKKGKKRLAMIIQTLCSMGIRISELSSITAESVLKGTVEIYCKGKQRTVLVPKKLQKLLLQYINENNIESGIVFRTSNGNAVDRSNIWREMKALSEDTGIGKEKIFPHNFRHLFAKTFYKIEKDIAKLADILGHSSMETTRIYIMTTYKEHQKQLDMMGLVVY